MYCILAQREYLLLADVLHTTLGPGKSRKVIKARARRDGVESTITSDPRTRLARSASSLLPPLLPWTQPTSSRSASYNAGSTPLLSDPLCQVIPEDCLYGDQADMASCSQLRECNCRCLWCVEVIHIQSATWLTDLNARATVLLACASIRDRMHGTRPFRVRRQPTRHFSTQPVSTDHSCGLFLALNGTYVLL